jgi:4-amino-4-deoxy-L-arabinose transferase-like glycosyltransferase
MKRPLHNILVDRIRSPQTAFLALMALCSVTFMFGLGRLPFVGPDEPRYAEVAREMFVSGDYITPTICGHDLFEKPILLYWGGAAAYHIFGVSEFAARFPSALAATMCAAILFFVISRTVSVRLGIVVSSVLATSGLFAAYARAAITDMLLTFAICAALSLFYLFATTERPARSILWIAGCAAVGISVLAKGLIGVVIVGAILIASRLITGRPRGICPRDLILGFLAFAVVVGAWYLPVTIEHGRSFINEFFINQHFKRYLSNRYSHPQPMWFFPTIILAGALPWTFFFAPAIVHLSRIRRRPVNNKEYLLVLAWIWLLFPVIFFSFSKSKLPGYVVPALPAAAIILAFEVERLWNEPRDRMLTVVAWLTMGLLLAISVALAVYDLRAGIKTQGFESGLSWSPFIVGLVGLLALLAHRTQAAIVWTVLVVSTLFVATTLILLPRLDDRLTQKRLALAAAAALRPKEKIAIYMDKKYAAVFYSNGRVVYSDDRGDGLNTFSLDEIAGSVRTYGSVIVITTNAHEGDLVHDPRFLSEPIAKQGKHTAIRVSPAQPPTGQL